MQCGLWIWGTSVEGGAVVSFPSPRAVHTAAFKKRRLLGFQCEL